jgi:hypothetical protein
VERVVLQCGARVLLGGGVKNHWEWENFIQICERWEIGLGFGFGMTYGVKIRP